MLGFASVSEKIRSVFFVAITLGAMALCAVDLMKIQVVDGAMYEEKAQSTVLAEQTVSAPRGEIVDKNGNELVSNKVGFSVVIEKAFFPSEKSEMNRIVLEIAEILQKDSIDWIDTLPISKTQPYTFEKDRESDIAKLRKNISVQPYATAEDCIAAMSDLYSVDSSYSDEQKRIIVGIRYEMFIRSFSLSNKYTFAQDIPMDTVVKLKECSMTLDGMDISEDAVRVYKSGNTAPHIIGTIGSINADEYDELKSSGYALNDKLGKSGIEKAMESVLRGKSGTRSIELMNGIVVSDKVTKDAVPGNTVKLTFDSAYQQKIQTILQNHIYWLQHQTSFDAKGTAASAGAIVVTDVSTGAVLAAATYPSYDINDYLENYSAVANGDNSPLLNRVTSGLYRPGSTFKTVTATAALNDRVITPNTIITCNKVYTYWDDYQPKCTGWHGSINVVTALEKSCNIFFYDTGRLLGIDRLSEYAGLYGFGKSTGIETGDASGYFACPDTFKARKLEWQAGLVVQAAIGQSETYVTPLQMCMQASTIANHGIRYKPYLVDSVYTYNMESLVSTTQPTIAETIPDTTGYTYDTIIQGMKKAADFAAYSYPTENEYYTDYLLTKLPEQAAIKTGTPQMTSSDDTGSAFIGFYPADNPRIAFSGFIEHGEYSKLMIKQIIQAYYNENYAVPSPVKAENVLSDTTD